MSKRFIFSLPVALLLTLVTLTQSLSVEEPPRLAAPSLSSIGAAEITLIGTSGTNYRIDASPNLTNWFEIGTGLAANGTYRVVHSGASNLPAMYYRAQVAPVVPVPLTVGVRADTNVTASALLTLSGGNCVLFGTGGTRLTLTVPSNCIPDATIVTMTLVTNIVDLPFAQGVLGSVRITPSSLAFWGAAALEIKFPTNIDRRHVASFACDQTGSNFQLTLDRVGTNRITIPIRNGGVFGSSLIRPEELTATAQRRASLTAASGIPRQKQPLASLFDCHPEKKTAAETARQQISAALAARSQVLTAQLIAAREAQSAEAVDDSQSGLSTATQLICEAYANEIAPRWPEASSNCAFAKMLTQLALGLIRQVQLLGGDESSECAGIDNVPFCAMFQNCLQETRECCTAGNVGPDKVAEVFGLLRQQALLGLTCISDRDAEDVISLCSSNAWTGSFSMKESGSKSDYTNFVSTEDTFSASFKGSVIESHESNFGANGYTLDLRVAGEVSLSDFHNQTYDKSSPCPEGGAVRTFSLQETKLLVATNTEYHVYITTHKDGSYVIFASNITPTGFGVSGIDTSVEIQESSTCNGPGDYRNKTEVTQGGALARSFPAFQGMLVDPNQIPGSYRDEDLSSVPQTHFEFDWNFRRNSVSP